MKILLQYGIDVNKNDNNYGHAAMFEACNIDIFELLIESGTDINCQNITGDTVLHRVTLGYTVKPIDIPDVVKLYSE
jgi:ankyrin repeat protein